MDNYISVHILGELAEIELSRNEPIADIHKLTPSKENPSPYNYIVKFYGQLYTLNGETLGNVLTELYFIDAKTENIGYIINNEDNVYSVLIYDDFSNFEKYKPFLFSDKKINFSAFGKLINNESGVILSYKINNILINK